MSRFLTVSFLAFAVFFLSWNTPPVAPLDFEDITYNVIVSDSTNGADNNLGAEDYGTCGGDEQNYDAGDKLYRLVVSEDTAVVRIKMTDPESAGLQWFLLENTIDTNQQDCPGECFNTGVAGDSVDQILTEGIYWIAVDGMISTQASEEGEGIFTLEVKYDKDYTSISCGQIIQDQTLGYSNNYNLENYVSEGCLTTLDNRHEAGDRLYRFVVSGNSGTIQTVRIDLSKIDNNNLHLFLLGSIPDASGIACPGGCFEVSNTGGPTEFIERSLPIGIYWIVVDGTSSIEDGQEILNEGSFSLSVSCQDDFSSILCGDLLTGTTENRVSYNSGYSCGDAMAEYNGGDITYQFNLPVDDDDITITLTPTNGDDLDVLLFSSMYIEEDSIYLPETCLEISDTSISSERIKVALTSGVYFIVVDGKSGLDFVNAGPFSLEVRCQALPVQLVSFTAQPKSEGIELTWETASEISFEGFYVQRSSSAEGWENLTWAASKGDPYTAASYSYMDKNPLSGANYFRLMGVDLDGTITYSNIVQVTFGGTTRSEISVVPTLLQDWMVVRGIKTGDSYQYELRSAVGSLIGHGSIGGDQHQIDVSGLASGLIYITIKGKDTIKTIPVVKL